MVVLRRRFVGCAGLHLVVVVLLGCRSVAPPSHICAPGLPRRGISGRQAQATSAKKRPRGGGFGPSPPRPKKQQASRPKSGFSVAGSAETVDAFSVAALVNDHLKLAWEPASQVQEACSLAGRDIAELTARWTLQPQHAVDFAAMCQTALAHDPEPTLWVCGKRSSRDEPVYKQGIPELPSCVDGGAARLARKLHAADMCAGAAVALYDVLSALLKRGDGTKIQINAAGVKGRVTGVSLQDVTPPGRYRINPAFGPDPRLPIELKYTNPVVMQLPEGVPRRVTNPLAMHTLVRLSVAPDGADGAARVPVWLDATAEQYDVFRPSAFGYAHAFANLEEQGHAPLREADPEARRADVDRLYPGMLRGVQAIVDAVTAVALGRASSDYVRQRPD